MVGAVIFPSDEPYFDLSFISPLFVEALKEELLRELERSESPESITLREYLDSLDTVRIYNVRSQYAS